MLSPCGRPDEGCGGASHCYLAEMAGAPMGCVEEGYVQLRFDCTLVVAIVCGYLPFCVVLRICDIVSRMVETRVQAAWGQSKHSL